MGAAGHCFPLAGRNASSGQVHASEYWWKTRCRSIAWLRSFLSSYCLPSSRWAGA